MQPRPAYWRDPQGDRRSEPGTAGRAAGGDPSRLLRCRDRFNWATPQARLFLVCDGHIGSTCSRLISKRFPEVLKSRLPRTEVPSEDDPAFSKYSQAVVRAMAESFVEIDNMLLREDIGRSGEHSAYRQQNSGSLPHQAAAAPPAHPPHLPLSLPLSAAAQAAPRQPCSSSATSSPSPTSATRTAC